MIYHFRSEDSQFQTIDQATALMVSDEPMIQWHLDDFTLIAQASYAIAGRYVKTSNTLVLPKSDKKQTLEQARAQVLSSSDHSIGESDQADELVFYELKDIELIKRKRSFPDEASFLVEFFVDCLVSMPTSVQTEDHEKLVRMFVKRLDNFLDAYKSLNLEDFAKYIANVGVDLQKARDDLDIILCLYGH